MDQFYLKNSALYQKLVNAYDPTTPAAHFSRHKATGKGSEPTHKADENDETAEEDLVGSLIAARQGGRSQVVDLHDLYNHPRGRPILKSSKHQVDRLFDSCASTQEIYDDLVDQLVAFSQNGGIGTLFAYGQTSSGKTFTISGLQLLATTALLDSASSIHLTICDLAGNSAYDLLNNRKPISVLEDASGTTHLSGATEHHVKHKGELSTLLEQATAFRRTAPTMKNDASSRSHSICRVRIPDTGGVLYLIDLAGSEAARDVSEHGVERMKETREINMSLSVLKDCMRGKAEGKKHVPIRQSTLTKVLKHVFDPQSEKECRTVVVACVNPSLVDVNATKNTLRYAEMLRVASSK